jgi:hypothetical protein
MRNRLVRPVIAALAVIGGLGLSSGPAAAAVIPAAVSGVAVQAAPTPAECQSIPGEIAALQAERRLDQELLQHATPSQKHDLIAEIRSLTQEIAALNARLRECPA